MQRKTFVATAALALAACGGSKAAELEYVEPASQFDYAGLRTLVDRPADVRQLWDAGSYQPQILGEIKNAYNGCQFGYGIAPKRIAMVLCLHGDSNAFAFDDSMWSKYNIGSTFGFKDPSGNVVTTNIFATVRSVNDPSANPNDLGGMYQDATIQGLQRRGLVVLVCHTGAADQARTIAAATGGSAQAVLDDLLAHLIPGAMAVPSQAATMGILQNRFKYAYTTAS